MYKKMIALSLIGTLLIGASFIFREGQFSTPALKDSFTRNFILQDEQAPEGFHLFKSKIDTYTMLFPSDFQLVSNPPEFYGRQGNFFELWIADLENSSKGAKKMVNLKGTFRLLGKGNVEKELEILKSERDRTKYYETYENEGNIIFLEKVVKNYDSIQKKMVLGDPNKQEANNYYGFVANKKTNQSLELVYSINCKDNCSIDVEKELIFMKTLLESVEFNN